MTPSRVGSLVKALVGLLALLVLVVGIPVFLVLGIGDPIPQITLDSPLTDTAWLQLVACVVWVLWAHWVICLGIELVGMIRGAELRQFKFCGPQQLLARTLLAWVTLAAVAVPTIAAKAPHTANADAPTTGPAIAVVQADSSAPGTSQAHDATTSPAAVTPVADVHETSQESDSRDTHSYVVKRGDSLWTIAERFYGDGAKCELIFKHNKGRTQHDGRQLEDADFILPGWQLDLPSLSHRDKPGLDRPQDSRAGHDRDDRKPGHSPDHDRSTDTDRGHHASQAPATSEPTAPATQQPHTPAAQTPSQAPSQAGSQAGSQAASPAERTDQAGDRSPLAWPIGVLAAGLLAGGLLVSVRVLRRRQMRNRRPGRTIELPPPQVRTVERNLHEVDRSASVAALDDQLRRLTESLRDVDAADLPDPLAVRVRPGALDLVLDAPASPPPPWRADGRLWSTDIAQEAEEDTEASRLDAAALADLTPPEALAPLPALATVGTDGEDLLLLDLERIGVLAVDGDPTQTQSLLRGLAAELACNSWSDHLEVFLVGVGEKFCRLKPDRMTHAAHYDDIASDIDATLAEIDEGLTRGQLTDTLAGRIDDTVEDPMMPAIVILAETPLPGTDRDRIDHLVAQLTNGKRRRNGVALVIAGTHPDAAWTLHVDADGVLEIPQLNISDARALAVPADAEEPLVQMLETARTGGDAPIPAAEEDTPWARGTNQAGDVLDDPGDEPGLPEQEPRPGTVAGDGPQTRDDSDGADDGDFVIDGDPFGSPDDAADEVTAADAATSSAETAQEPARITKVGPPLVLNEQDSHSSEETPPTSGAITEDQGNTKPPSRTVTLDSRRPRPEPVGYADPDLDKDVAAWHDESSTRPKIQVFGKVSITAKGPAPDKSKTTCVELAAFMATRAHPVTASDIDGALWPEKPRQGGYRRTLLSWLRKWLGKADDGRDYLPKQTPGSDQTNGTYQLDPSVILDWHLFRRLRTRATTTGGAAERADLRAALSLVEGPPFAEGSVKGFGWLIDDGLHHVMFGAVLDVAHRLVDLCLDAGDIEGARWAVERARACDVYATSDTPLVDAIRVEVAAGNDHEARQRVKALVDARELSVEEDLAPDTYSQLLELDVLPRDGRQAAG